MDTAASLGELLIGLIILGTFAFPIIPAAIIIGLVYLIKFIIKAGRGEVGLTDQEIKEKRAAERTPSREEQEQLDKIRRLREKLYS